MQIDVIFVPNVVCLCVEIFSAGIVIDAYFVVKGSVVTVSNNKICGFSFGSVVLMLQYISSHLPAESHDELLSF